MDFRAIRNASGLKQFINFVKLSDGLVLADVIKTSDDYIIRIWYSLVPTTSDELLEYDCDFWFVKANLDVTDWYDYLAVLARYTDKFDDNQMFWN